MAAGGTGTDEDVAFHRLLCRMARNQVLLQLHDQIVAVLRESRNPVQGVRGRSVSSLQEHQGILAAVATGEAELARERMVAHLTAVATTLATLQRDKSATKVSWEDS